MDQLIPRPELTRAPGHWYPAPTGPGLRPKGLQRMRRVSLMQRWFDRSDPGFEGVPYDSRS